MRCPSKFALCSPLPSPLLCLYDEIIVRDGLKTGFEQGHTLVPKERSDNPLASSPCPLPPPFLFLIAHLLLQMREAMRVKIRNIGRAKGAMCDVELFYRPRVPVKDDAAKILCEPI